MRSLRSSFLLLVRVLHWERRCSLPGMEEKKGAVSFKDKKFEVWPPLLVRVFHGEWRVQLSKVRREAKEQTLSWMRSLRFSSGQSSPSGTESFTVRYEREEKNRVRHG
jgi:hypothetical protein